ncbi:hypothetical protein GCK32_001402 [Trichostrongylus colubriformis]|uniref:Uncharacterized protein n=1 Tax=Trichostrongylus colubriformis TaxID=6319 RepID=A0AAN8FDE5_TRICO
MTKAGKALFKGTMLTGQRLHCRRNLNAARSEVCLIVEIQTRAVARIAARTWIELKTVWKEGSVAFVRRVWLKTNRRRGASIRTSSEAEKLFEKEATTYHTY